MPPKKGRPPKPKPLTQKAEKEMMGQEDIASANREADDIRAKAVARMAKAREAKAEKKKAVVVAPSKENITLKINEAPYGLTASGKKRSKPLKEKPPKAPKPIKEKPIKAPKAPKAPKAIKAPPPTAKEFNAYIAELQKKKEAIPPPPPLKKDLTPIEEEKKGQIKLRKKIHTLPEELRKYTREFVGKEKVNMVEITITPLGDKDGNLEHFIEEYMLYNNNDGWDASEWSNMIQNAEQEWVLLDNKDGDVYDAVAETLEDEDYAGEDLIDEDPEAHNFVRIGEESATGISPNALDLLQALEIYGGLVKLKYKYDKGFDISKKGEIDKPPPVRRLNNRPVWGLIKPHLNEAYGRGAYIEDRYDNSFYVSIGYIKEILESALEMGEEYDATDVYDNIRSRDKKDPYITDQVLHYLFSYNPEEVPNLFEDPLFNYGEADDSEYRNESEASSPSSSRSSSGWETEGEGLKGGALSSKNLRGLLNASYEGNTNVGDFILDKGLSTSTSKVYHNPKNNQTVVAHRGTEGLVDWGNNLVYAVGGKSAYKMTPRYKEAEAVQKKAESKYGATNVSTIGHSQGGLQSELLGGKSKEIITLNKATRPFESNKNKNQTDVRSGRDVVSALNPFEKKSPKRVEIQGETYNPLTEHNPNILDRLDDDQMIGEEMVGGAVADQRNLAGILRQRFQDKDIEAALSTKSITAKLFYSLLSQLVHSAETEDINKIPDKNRDYEGWRKSQANNAYLDRANRYDYVRPFEYKDNAGNIQTTTPPTPDELLKNAIFEIVEFIRSRPDQERRAIVTKGAKGGLAVIKENLLENTKKGKRPQDVFADEREAINDAQEEYRQEAEQKGDKRGYLISKVKSQGKLIVAKGKDKTKLKDTAFWTDDRDRRVIKMKEFATDMVNAWRIGDGTEYLKIRTNFLNTTKLNTDYNKWYDNAVNKVGQDQTIDILRELKPFEKLTTDNITKKFNITAAPFRDRNLKGKHLITGVGDDIELTIQGKGLPLEGEGINKINFEDMNWGSLTEQMKAYNSQHSKDLDLEGFARMIVADPKSFQKRTLQRARFYINVLLPKKK